MTRIYCLVAGHNWAHDWTSEPLGVSPWWYRPWWHEARTCSHCHREEHQTWDYDWRERSTLPGLRDRETRRG